MYVEMDVPVWREIKVCMGGNIIISSSSSSSMVKQGKAR
jgi:hypothetical protein